MRVSNGEIRIRRTTYPETYLVLTPSFTIATKPLDSTPQKHPLNRCPRLRLVDVPDIGPSESGTSI